MLLPEQTDTINLDCKVIAYCPILIPNKDPYSFKLVPLDYNAFHIDVMHNFGADT